VKGSECSNDNVDESSENARLRLLPMEFFQPSIPTRIMISIYINVDYTGTLYR
jgi:hypothetical protein